MLKPTSGKLNCDQEQKNFCYKQEEKEVNYNLKKIYIFKKRQKF